MSPASLL